MKQFLLLGLCGSMALGAYAKADLSAVVIDEFTTMKVSSNGLYGIGKDAQMINLKTGDQRTFSGDPTNPATLGFGNCVSDEGVAVGHVNGKPMLFTLSSSSGTVISSLPTSNTFPMAITPDGTRLVGYYKASNRQKNQDTDEWNMPEYVPFYCDITNGTVGSPVELPVITEDFKGLLPSMVTAEWISSDGNTIAGMVLDYSGQNYYPVIYKNDGGSWSYILPTGTLFDKYPYPTEPQAPVNPRTDEELAKKFVDPSKWDSYQENIDKDWGVWVIEDDVNPDLLDEFKKMLQVYDDWYDGGESEAWLKYEADKDAYNENVPFFSQNSIVMDALGNYMVATQAKVDLSGDEPTLEGGSDNMLYYLWRFNLADGTYQQLDSKYSTLKPSQLLNNGALLTYTASGQQSYILKPNENDFTLIDDYLAEQQPAYLTWLKENYTRQIITGYTEPEDDSDPQPIYGEGILVGVVNALTPDLSTMIGGINVENTSGDLNQTYILTEAIPDYTVTPVNGSLLTELQDIAINWGTNEILQKDLTGITFAKEGGNPVDFTASVKENKLQLAINGTVDEAGKYIVTVPAGSIYVYQGVVGVPCDEMTLTYTVTDGTGIDASKVNPAEGVVKTLAETIVVEWDAEIQLNSDCTAEVTLSIDGDEKSVEATVSNNSLVINLGQEYTVPGEYIVSVPGGYVWGHDSEGEKVINNSLVLTYTISPNVLDKPTVTPQEGNVEALDRIVLSWKANGLKVKDGVVTLKKDGAASDITVEAMPDGGDLYLVLSSPVNEEGNYIIEVPANFVEGLDETGNKVVNDGVTLNYVVSKSNSESPNPGGVTSGVGSLYLDGQLIKVYNLNGVNVMNTEDASQVEKLKPGIYVINGKKVVIRK